MNASRFKNFDVIVVGAGAIGAACALKLAQEHSEIKILVVERASQPLQSAGNNRRVWALGHAATGLLNDLGTFQALGEEACHAYTQMRVCDADSDGELIFQAADYQSDELGFMVDADACTQLLQGALVGQANIQTQFNFTCRALTTENAQAKLVGACDDEEFIFTSSLVIAADGGRSWVRQQAKIFAPANTYGQQGIVTKISTQKSHNNTAWQRFFATGPLAVLPLHDNQSSIVWSADDEFAKQLLSLSKIEFAERLELAMESRLGAVRVHDTPIGFPLQSRHAERYWAPNIVLVGDAAHSIHPLAGQGANLGFKDVLAVTAVLRDCPPDSWGDAAVLKKYQRRRRLDNIQTDLLMSTLHRVFKNNAPLWTLARGQGMQALSHSAVLKNILATQAMGL